MAEGTVALLNQNILDNLVEEIILIQKQNLLNRNLREDSFPSLSKLEKFVQLNRNNKKIVKLAAAKAALKFRIAHALHIYQSNAIYTYIPKNACSTMRYSVALTNGFIQKQEEWRWIHTNDLTQSVKNLSYLLNPNYSFVILRCPYGRLVSVFFDKFINNKPHAKKFMQKYMSNLKIDNLSFQDFVNRISEIKSVQYDHHWRPQTDFLLYKEYTRYFALEELETASKTLEQDIGFKVHDTRKIVGHHTSHVRKIEHIQEPWYLSIKELRELSQLPKVQSMYSKEMIKKVKTIYAEDIDFYSSKFGNKNLSFN